MIPTWIGDAETSGGTWRRMRAWARVLFVLACGVTGLAVLFAGMAVLGAAFGAMILMARLVGGLP